MLQGDALTVNARTFFCSVWAHNWFHIASKSMNIETKSSRAHVVNRKLIRCKGNELREKFHLTHWLSSSASQVKHFLMFIIYVLKFLLFFIFSLSAIFSFSHFYFFFSTIDLNWSIFFYVFSGEVFSATTFQFCNFNCYVRREKKNNEKCEHKRMKSDLWNSIGMRWNFHWQLRHHRRRLTFRRWEWKHARWANLKFDTSTKNFHCDWIHESPEKSFKSVFIFCTKKIGAWTRPTR